MSFIEAVSVFYDDNAILIAGPDHSAGEERFLLLGRSDKDNLLVVVHCERNTNIRIISARRATKRESSQYRGVHKMRDEYDFSNGVKKPYAKGLKSKSVVTIRIEDEVISYFKQLAEEVNLPYQTLINLYLKDCVAQQRKPTITW